MDAAAQPASMSQRTTQTYSSCVRTELIDHEEHSHTEQNLREATNRIGRGAAMRQSEHEAEERPAA